MYAEGQRRYVESLSSYARMFLGQMSKPDLDSIDGLSPAVSIDQKTTSKNPRSTVGTTTEIYDYLRLLFARVGVPHCPECGRVIKKQTTDQVTDEILALAPDAKAIIMAPVVTGRKGEFTKLFADLQKEGFSRVRIDGEIVKLDGEPRTLNKKIKHFIDVVVDRVQMKASATSRIAEAVELATKLADGRVLVQVLGDDGQPLDEAGGQSSGAKGGLGEGEHIFSLALACPEHGHSMDELQPRDFSFNAPYGACPDCLGIGSREEVDASLVVPDPSLSLNGGRHRAVQDRQLLPAGAARRGRALRLSTPTPRGRTCRRRRSGACWRASARTRCASSTSRWTGARRTGTSSGARWPRCSAATRRRSRTRSARSWPATSPSCRARPAAASA